MKKLFLGSLVILLCGSISACHDDRAPDSDPYPDNVQREDDFHQNDIHDSPLLPSPKKEGLERRE